MDAFFGASVDSLLSKIKNLASRPIVEFNKYEAMELLEALKNTAHDVRHEKDGYYRLEYETLRGKLELPNNTFRNFLSGDKDRERILEVVAKVEKTNRRHFQPTTSFIARRSNVQNSKQCSLF